MNEEIQKLEERINTLQDEVKEVSAMSLTTLGLVMVTARGRLPNWTNVKEQINKLHISPEKKKDAERFIERFPV